MRRVTLDEAGLMLAIWNDPAFVHNVGDRGIRTLKQAEAALIDGAFTLYARYGYGPYSVMRKSDAVLIGICGLFRRENLDDPDIGFALLPEYYGLGFAEEAANAVVSHARDDLGLAYLTAIVSPENTASIRLIEKLGLTFDRSITMPDEQEEIRLYGMKLE